MSVSSAAHPLLLDPDYSTLKQHLIESTGLAYYADRDSDLATRISARLSELTLKGCGTYLDLLKNPEGGEAERHLLISHLTIGETYFFRHTEQFDALRDLVLPDIIERNQAHRRLRIWSAGCAIGAEPYSLGILLHEHFAPRIAGWDVQILGTDINQRFLARASAGEFNERALRSTPDEVKRRWFLSSGSSWTVKPLIKECVSFQHHNLVEHPYPSIVHGIAALDLILCRNVMIYFDWAVTGRVIGRFHECLVDGGWLAVGHAESNTDVFRTYRTVNVPGATIYQKRGDHQVAPSPAVSPALAPTMSQPACGQQQWSPPVLPDVPASSRPGPARGPVTPALDGLALVRQLADQGNWIDAARRCELLLEADPLNAAVHFYQALIMEQMKQNEDAEQALRRALYLDRGFLLAHYHLATLLGKTGRRDSAIQSLRNVQGLLSRMDKNQPIADADGLTRDDLGQLIDMQLEFWQK